MKMLENVKNEISGMYKDRQAVYRMKKKINFALLLIGPVVQWIE